MREQVLIIGLDQFGMSLARTLCEKGFQVIAVDTDQKLVNEASNFATDSIGLSAIDEASLSKLSPKDRDIIICAIGSREPSILAVALLKQMGCENIIARASESIHARILKAIGAKFVINPEYEYGKKLASKLLFKSIFMDNILGEIDFMEIPIKSFEVDKNIIKLNLPDKLKVIPQQHDDCIIITGSAEDIENMMEDSE